MKECFKNYIQIFSNEDCSFCMDICDLPLGMTRSCNDCVIEHSGYAQGYIPSQEDTAKFSEEKSFVSGTVFKALSMPYKKGSALMRYNMKE